MVGYIKSKSHIVRQGTAMTNATQAHLWHNMETRTYSNLHCFPYSLSDLSSLYPQHPPISNHHNSPLIKIPHHVTPRFCITRFLIFWLQGGATSSSWGIISADYDGNFWGCNAILTSLCPTASSRSSAACWRVPSILMRPSGPRHLPMAIIWVLVHIKYIVFLAYLLWVIE